MNSAPGTKLSYRAGKPYREGDSTVIVLKTGELMEVRRGDATTFNEFTVRHRWPTVDAWVSTLPAGASIHTEEAPAKSTKSVAEEHPDFQRIALFLTKHNCGRSWTPAARTSLSRYLTNAERVKQLQGLIKLWLKTASQCNSIRAPDLYAEYIKRIQDASAKIKELQGKPEKPLRYFFKWKPNCANALVYGSNGDGLTAIALRVSEGLFAVEKPDGRSRVVRRLEELGFASYFVRVGVKILPLS
jgi:hypothetical protein